MTTTNTAMTTTEIGTWNIDRADGVRLCEGVEGTRAEAIEIAQMHCRLSGQPVTVEAA
jgi:hypothetical protein